VSGSATEPTDGYGPVDQSVPPFNLPGLVSVGELHAETEGDGVAVGDPTGHLGFARSLAQVADADVGLGSFTFESATSRCRSDGDGSTGVTTIEGGLLGDVALPSNPAPNALYTHPNGLQVVLNEQVVTNGAGSTAITVRGAHVTAPPGLGGLLGGIDIVLAESRCAATGPDVNTTSTSTSPSTSTSIAPTVVISGTQVGPVTVNAGQRVRMADARMAGRVTVNPGGVLDVVNSQISRGIIANAPGTLTVCGSRVVGPPPGVALAVTNATGLVRVGDPATGCAGNTFAGQVNLTANQAVTFGANTVSHNATVNGGGPGATVIKANTVFGTLGCSGNGPSPTNSGQANTAGSRTGQCVGL
jgi:hypothetical protein